MPNKRVFVENETDRINRLREPVKRPKNQYDDFKSTATLKKDKSYRNKVIKFYGLVKGMFEKKIILVKYRNIM